MTHVHMLALYRYFLRTNFTQLFLLHDVIIEKVTIKKQAVIQFYVDYMSCKTKQNKTR